MKQSGIDWIGEIPDDWKIIRLKHIFQIKKDIAGKEGFTVLSVTQTGIRPKDMSSKGQFALDYSKYQLVNSGEFIMNHMDLKTGWIDISKYNGVTSPDYRVFYLTDKNCVKDYYKQIFQYCYKNLIFFSLGQGVADFGRWRLPAEMFNNFKLPLPPKATQQRIAEYLDSKCTQIDSIIEESKKSIEEFKAWKQSVIFEAVTGKNLNCKKKDSGIEWIGEIPEGWEIRQIRNVILRGKNGIKIGPFGSTLTNKTEANYPYNIYGQANLVSNDFSFTKNTVSKQVFEELKNYEVIAGDICLSMMGTIGKCRTVPKGIKQGIMDSHLIKIRLDAKIITNSYFEYVYDKDYSGLCYQQMQHDKKGSIMDGLNTTIVKSLLIPLPSITEQETIAKFLDSKCAQIDSLIAEKESLIEDLTEYKKSLIFEVVTGKRSI